MIKSAILMDTTEAKLKVTVNELLKLIEETLDCSQRVIANLMGVTPHTLSNNKASSLKDLTPRTKNKLLSLYRIVVEDLGSHRPEMIYEILNTHIYKDHNGHSDSLVSAIQQDKYEYEMLSQMAILAIKNYEQKRLAKLIKYSEEVLSATA